MGYPGRRIGKSQDQGDSNPTGADGAVGGGILDLFANGYFERQGDIYNAPGVELRGIEASGGVVSDFRVGLDVYRAHVFESSGTFEVTGTAAGGLPNNLEYLVVAGGGGGGGESSQAGGGGAGGFRTNLTGHPVKAADLEGEIAVYTVTVGAGGNGGVGPSPQGEKYGQQGGNSEFFKTGTSYPDVKRIRSVGGGGGQGYGGAPVPQMNGGSGGGAICTPTPYAGGTGNTTDPNHPQVQGYDGGNSSPSYVSPYAGGGGGGAGRTGAPDSPSTPQGRSTGGYGLQCLIAHNPANPESPIGAPGPDSNNGYFAGGGGGGSYAASGGAGGYGGGADGGGTNIPSKNGPHGTYATGGGGGGSGHVSGYGRGGNGGSGIVVVRYKIAELTGEAKATGGAVSFAGGKTIHTFTTSGDFNNTSGGALSNVDYLVVAGGGGGAGANGSADGAAGGGAGGLRTSHPSCPGVLKGTELTISTGPHAITIGAGGAGGMYGPGNDGAQGGQSIIAGHITSDGGGFGALGAGKNGGAGGSGGGSSGGSSAGVGGAGNSPPTSPPQGNAGGDNGPNFGSGGGGGFTQPGFDSVGDNGGVGGAGIDLTISGVSTGYAGGGGGGCAGPYRGSYTGGTATHGGGAGADSDGTNFETYQGGHGDVGTGGGGGGGGGTNSPESVYSQVVPNAVAGGNGGAGIVIIAYPT